MDTVSDNYELPPNPVEVIDSFQAAHGRMVKSALAAYENPSHPALAFVAEQVEAAAQSIQPFFFHNFFQKTGNELGIVASLRSVKEAIDDSIAQAHSIDPNCGTKIAFMVDESPEESLIEQWTRQLIEEDDAAADRITEGICKGYTLSIQTLESAVMNCHPVVEFIASDIRRARRNERLMHYGGIMLASFVGAKLALVSKKSK